MSEVQQVEDFFYRTLQQYPTHIAIKEVNGKEISYQELDQVVERYTSALLNLSITPGDHIALTLHKTIETVAWILACLRCKAVYVPIDITSPLKRLEEIIQGSEAKLILSPTLLGEDFQYIEELDGAKLYAQPSVKRSSVTIKNGAYILYTSGSTGKPKGVVHTHQSASHFISWSIATFSPQANDVIASIAPFHFDLSIFDLFASLGSGSTLLLIDEEMPKNPLLLAQTLAQEQVSICYTTPTLLSLLLQYGKLEKHNFSYLKQVLFAGEVFQPNLLHQLMEQWNEAHFFNLYGPTETNVCTFYPIPKSIDKDRTKPYPIGSVISGVELHLEVENGSNWGELWIAGNCLMTGYWNASKEEENVLKYDASGTKWYNTGDLVSKDAEGNLVFHGRKDRMVKRNGYRIEPAEIERALAIHPDVVDAAVVVKNVTTENPKLRAYLVSSADVSIIAIKTHCVMYLPTYMMPDEFYFVESIPQTSNHKVDLNQLTTL